jgi:hypothetical protein
VRAVGLEPTTWGLKDLGRGLSGECQALPSRAIGFGTTDTQGQAVPPVGHPPGGDGRPYRSNPSRRWNPVIADEMTALRNFSTTAGCLGGVGGVEAELPEDDCILRPPLGGHARSGQTPDTQI